MLSNLEIIGTKNIPRTAKIVRGRRPSPIWLSEEIFNLIISELDKHVVLFVINYIASQSMKHCQENYYPRRMAN